MRTILYTLIILTSAAPALGTTPYPPKVFEDGSWAFAAAFAWPDENEKVLIIRTPRKTTMYSLEELNIKDRGLLSTAGYKWYQNSIGFTTSVKIKGADEDSSIRIFYFRDKDGREAVIDLRTNELVEPSNILDEKRLDAMSIHKASLLLRSTKSKDRETAAIHLGQLRASKYLSDLHQLLNDDSYYSRGTSRSEMTKVYFVREAAASAILAIEVENSANKSIEEQPIHPPRD